MVHDREFASMSDIELVKGLMTIPPNSRLHEYFFCRKCKRLLEYISNTLYNGVDGGSLVGELYEYLSNDNWKVLRMWEGKNGCSLNSYLASCSLRHFASKVRTEEKRSACEVLPSSLALVESLEHFTVEEEDSMPPVWEAYWMLGERDRLILRLLVIEGRDVMDVAPQIWKYMNSSYALYELTQKKVQSIIAMAKHRALIALAVKLNSLSKN